MQTWVTVMFDLTGENMKNKFKVVLTTAVVMVTLAACSSSKSTDSPEDSGADVSATEGSTQVTVQVDQEIKDALNVEAGSAVIPGSIEVVPQELGDVCTEAVAPLREIISKYPSARQVDNLDAFNAALVNGRAACELENAQEWSDFYTKEVAGWIYAKTGDVAQVPETTVAP